MPAKYDRIASDLRAKIAQGTYSAGHRLPIEAELMDEYGVSLSTVRKALDLLEAEGLIEKQHGTGSFVKQTRQRIHRSAERYQWEKNRVDISDATRGKTGATEYDTGLVLDNLLFDIQYDRIPSTIDLSQSFAIQEQSQLLRRIYKTRKSDERAPLGISTSYIPVNIIESNPALLDSENEPWPGGTQHQLWTVGVELDRITDKVTARPCTAEESDELDIRSGAPILALRKTSIDTNDRVVEIADAIWPGDRIEMFYTTQLERWTK